ncbi:baseplate wedge subunit [Pseudomonas phage PspYZU05]|uniref:Baseplate wedge protein gp6 n=1 Tax=Pseudomonas phage PspYZU05 TaxID=1983556 RepID=A0A2U7N533_9CAUD|nr:baseplate wedge subunit [Pseudomonas phage PspYZU05]ASD52066.1 baseplate wedge subunit [Pseudomonas phage PspYZU05]
MATEPVNYQLTRRVNEVPKVFTGATFFEIKQNISDWIREDDKFKDYDFEASRLNVLMDELSYTIMYIQQFSNTATYESFIRTANLRSSVVQAAQDSGYFPNGYSTARNSLMLEVSHSLNPTSIMIKRGTKFLAYARETSADPYPFVTLEDVIAVRDTNNRYHPIVSLAQGRIIRTELRFDKSKQILIRDKFIDRDYVRVFVDGAEWVDWTRKSMVHAGSTSTIFYMRETIDGHTEIFFGEGESSVSVDSGQLEANYIGGLKPLKDSTIVIEYIRTDGAKANGATEFSYADSIQYIEIQKIIENYNDDPDYVGSDGGGDPEDIERIRELAPIKRESQSRCVTASDYDVFVSEKFGSIVQAVQTFTDIDKPGYAFISIKPKSGLYLSSVQREDIQNYLDEYNVSTITPTAISPNYLFLKHNIKVTYALNKLQESEQWLRSKVIDQIDRYYIDEVEMFNKSFAKSRMLKYIDQTDHSIIGSSASIQMVREVMNFYNTSSAGIKYYNQYNRGDVVSSEFKYKPTTGTPYNVRIVATNGDNRGKGHMLIGPFRNGDVQENANITPYTGTDFDKMAAPSDQVKYYDIGDIDYFADYIYWNISRINQPDTKFEVQTIELYSTPMEDNIFTRDGSLIVFEDDLRPQYTTITLEPITL